MRNVIDDLLMESAGDDIKHLKLFSCIDSLITTTPAQVTVYKEGNDRKMFTETLYQRLQAAAMMVQLFFPLLVSHFELYSSHIRTLPVV